MAKVGKVARQTPADASFHWLIPSPSFLMAGIERGTRKAPCRDRVSLANRARRNGPSTPDRQRISNRQPLSYSIIYLHHHYDQHYDHHPSYLLPFDSTDYSSSYFPAQHSSSSFSLPRSVVTLLSFFVRFSSFNLASSVSCFLFFGLFLSRFRRLRRHSTNPSSLLHY